MYLLYVDDAGAATAVNERYFVLAGVAIFERQAFFLQRALNRLAARITSDDPNALEFHGNEMQSGRKRWRGLGNRPQRRTHLRHALATIRDIQGEWCLFAAVIDKEKLAGSDPVDFAFEQIISRFDMLLSRLDGEGNTQCGLLILDKSTRETRLQALADGFRQDGYSWGRLHNIADVPFFVDSKATRLIQYADLVAYALYRKYERGDPEFFAVIEEDFDCVGDRQHGLYKNF